MIAESYESSDDEDDMLAHHGVSKRHHRDDRLRCCLIGRGPSLVNVATITAQLVAQLDSDNKPSENGIRLDGKHNDKQPCI